VDDNAIRLDDLAIEEIRKLAGQPSIPLELQPLHAFFLIAQLQLALRHPHNTGRPAEFARDFIAVLHAQIAPEGSVVDRIIQAGFDPAFDRKQEGPNAR